MHSNFPAYWRSRYREIIAVLVIFVVTLSLPPFSLFADRAVGMLQLHLLMELFAVIVALLIAVVSWHDLKNTANPQSALLMAGFTVVAILDLVHALTYDGMPKLVTESSTQRAIFFWLAGRTLVELTLLLWLLRIRLELSHWIWLLFALLISAGMLWIGTYGLAWVPDTFVAGIGVTPFKRNYEFGLCLADLLLALTFIYRAQPDKQQQFFTFASSCFIMGIGEVAFSNYRAPSDFLNMFGHVFKIASYALLYQAMFVTAIRLPYQRLAASEQTLQVSEERFALAMQGASDGLWDWNLETDEVYYSPRWKQMLGYDESELAYRLETGVDLLHPDDKDRILEAIEDYVGGRADSFSAEMRMRHKDGHWVDMLSRAVLVRRASDGKPVRLVGTHVDITERKRLEDELRLSSLVLQHSGEAMMVTDEKNRIIAVNPAFTRVTGYTLAEVLGADPNILSSGKHDQDFYRLMWEQLLNTDQWQGELWDKRKNGDIYVKWLTINAIRYEDGSVHRYVALFSDITAKKQSEELIWKQANFDTLTGLPNRNMFRDRMLQEIMKAARTQTQMALFLIDLDQFKDVNDALGHDVGDILLKKAAQRIRACVRVSDTVARLGGDEFTVILAELEGHGHLDVLAQKLITELAAPYHLGNETVHVSASIGISLYPDDANDIDVLMKNADQAMYAAKNRGRNRFSYFTSTMQEAAQARLHLNTELRLALEREEFVLHYQPQVNIETGRVTGVEALVRWRHPDKGLLPPGLFIPIAEETGLILPLGFWVLRTACRQFKQWSEQGMTNLQVSVNLSARQFRQPSLAATITAILHETGVSPSALELEITESLAMEHPVENARTLAILRGLGLNLAIDDFGTGHSSLGYLKDFPINRLKLDRSFIINIETEPNDAIIVAATIGLAHDLGLDVVAEGVETERQAQYLTRLDCDSIQGYYFSRPLPAAEVEAYIRKRNAAPRFLPDRSPSAVEVMVIDDDEFMCQFLAHAFEQIGHRPSTATDPVRGLELLCQNPGRFELILVDMLMPNMSGIDLVKAIRKIKRDTPIVVVTAHLVDEVRKAFKPLEKEYNLLPGINYFVLGKPVSVYDITQLTQKLIHAHV